MDTLHRQIHVLTFVGIIIAETYGVTALGIESGQLLKIGTCTCPEDIVIYNCIVNASVPGGFTIWKGSAFDCPTEGNRILLRHNSFSSGAFGSCTGGALTGRSSPTGAVMTTETTYIYTSQLQVNLNANPSLNGKTIECVYNPNGNTIISIDTATVDTTAPIPPPVDVQLVYATPNELTFSWSSPRPDCSTLRYQIESDCGLCSMNNNSQLDTMRTNSATCTFEPAGTSDNFCSFTVRSIVCRSSITGNLSMPVRVNLKVPVSPLIQDATPTYGEDNKLVTVALNFAKEDPFETSQGFNDSSIYYVVNFSDSTTNVVCDSVNISASSCDQGDSVCTVTSNNLSNCSLNRSINASVTAVNKLGNSPTSDILIESTNSYVNVSFESNEKIVCTFPEESAGSQNQNDKSCDIMYGSCDQQQLTMSALGISNSSTTVIINFQPPLASYCYIVNANNGTFAIQIQGMFRPGQNKSQVSTLVIVIVVTVFIIVALLTIIIIMSVVLFRYKHQKLCFKRHREEGSEDTILLGESKESLESQPVRAHIVFDVENKPDKLVNALKVIKSLTRNAVNIKNIKIGIHQSEKPQSALRTVYIECDQDLSGEDEENIRNGIEVECKLASAEVYREARDKQVQKDKEHDSRCVRVITEVLKHAPGALCSLLEIFQETEECKHISITDIIIDHESVQQKNDPACKRVTIRFIPELPSEWRQKYIDKKKENCEFIMPTIEDKSLSTSL